MMVKMCLLPEVDVSQSVTNFIERSVRNLCHLQWILLYFGLVTPAEDTVSNILADVLFIPFQ